MLLVSPTEGSSEGAHVETLRLSQLPVHRSVIVMFGLDLS